MAAMSPASTPTHSRLGRLADWCYRHRRTVVLGWIGTLIGTIALSGALAGEFSMTFNVPGAESEEARQLLERHFPDRAGDTIQVAFEAEEGVADPAVRERVQSTLEDLAAVDHVIAVISPYDDAGARQISPGGTIAYAELQLDVPADQFVRADAQAMIATAEAADTEDVNFELGGWAIVNAEEIEPGSEGIGLLVAALILLISFGSLLAMGLPILTAVFGLGIASALIGLLTNVVETPEWAPSVAAMIGIGVGIDYALFIITRYRSALHSGEAPRQAVMTSLTTAGRAVLFAGCVVIIALLGLFTMNLAFLRGLSLSAISAVLVIMLASVTLLPAVLGFVGHTIDRLRVPLLRTRGAGDKASLSYRWSRVVQRYPWPAALIATLVLLALAAPLFGLKLGFPDSGNDPEDFTTRHAYDLLAEGFGDGFNGPLLLVIDGEGDRAAIQRQVGATDGIAFAAPAVPSPDDEVALLAAFPTTSPQAAETEALVDRLRDTDFGARVLVTGATAGSIDANGYVADRLPLFIGSVVILSFLLLMVVFRSLLVPLKAALMNILSIGAAYGVVALAVKGGTFGGIFGITEPVPVPSFIPMMMFAVLFGLSMDYEVFLLSRVREEYVRTRDNAAAVADGLAATARVITAAAAIMIAVFLAFVLGDQIFLKIMGVGMATAIFVDATIVRMVLVPATMELLGDANWWLPKWLDRRLPELHVEGTGELVDDNDVLDLQPPVPEAAPTG